MRKENGPQVKGETGKGRALEPICSFVQFEIRNPISEIQALFFKFEIRNSKSEIQGLKL